MKITFKKLKNKTTKELIAMREQLARLHSTLGVAVTTLGGAIDIATEKQSKKIVKKVPNSATKRKI